MFLVDLNFKEIEKITSELTHQHQLHLQKEYQNQNLLFGGRKVPRSGGVIISRHTNESELRRILDSDPFIVNGVASYSITEFEPVMASKDFVNLLSEQPG